MVFSVDAVFLFLVLFGVKLGFFLGLLNVFFAHVARVLNGDRLLFAGSFVFSGDVEDAVSVEVKGNFDLRDAARGGGNTVKDETAERFVVFGKFALALEDMDFNLGLIVGSGAKDFGLAGRDSGVAVD